MYIVCIFILFFNLFIFFECAKNSVCLFYLPLYPTVSQQYALFVTDLADCSKSNGENYFPKISLEIKQEFIKIYITDYTVLLKLFSVGSQLSVDGQ